MPAKRHPRSIIASAIVLLAAGCTRDPAAPPPSPLAKESARLARGVDPRCYALPLEAMGEPVLLEGSEVAYSLQALAAGAEGRVSVGCTITEEGRVAGCAVLKSDVPAIDESVIAALQTRIYCPATKDAWPVATYKTFNFRFELADDAPRRR